MSYNRTKGRKILNQIEKLEINLQNVVGICRTVDSLGRIVIPKEIRSYLNIQPKDEMEMIFTQQRIWTQKRNRND